jgi:dipeptidyl aminopeptidase/acylaminoacyl peptidase
VAFSASSQGVTELVVRELSTGSERVVHRGAPHQGQASQPAWSPDGTRLAFVLHEGGARDLHVLDLATRKRTRITHDAAEDLTPAWSPDGAWVVWASDRDGTFDIYAWRADGGATARITRVLSAAIEPAIAEDGTLWYRAWSETGWDLWRLPFRPDRAEPAAPPDARPFELYAPPPVPGEWTDYDPLPSLAPRVWFPDFTLSTEGGFDVVLPLGATDAAGHHSWGLETELSTEDPWPAIRLSYANQRFLPTLGSSLGWYRRERTGYVNYDERTWEEQVVYGNVYASVPFPGVRETMSATARVDMSYGFLTDSPTVRPDPVMHVPSIPRQRTTVGVTLAWRYDDTDTFTWSISRERGRRFGLSFRLESPVFGSAETSWNLRWDWSEFIALPYAPGHVLALRYDGGVGGSESGADGRFSLGGVPSRPLLDDILNDRGVGSGLLRGYAPDAFRGSQLHLVNAEYRLPLLYVHRGIGTLPVFLERVHAAVFADVGTATNGNLLDAPVRAGVGVELRANLELFYGDSVGLRLGLARGLHDLGLWSLYLVSGYGF